ncbi:PQQ-binding-like beta-propeller repeat protein [bacterium]|nr:PQQ-binding-like beta-propeller repeat protein [bacterium]
MIGISWTCLLTCSILAGEATTISGPITQFLEGRRPASEAAPTPPMEWSSSTNIEWTQDLPGRAWSSPLVMDGKVYLTDCVSEGKELDAKKGLYLDDLDARKYPLDTATRQWRVISLDLATGKKLWDTLLYQGPATQPHHIKNTLASETPCSDGKHLFVCFGNVGLYCLDMNGEKVWSHTLDSKPTRYGWGTSQSPIIHKGVVYLAVDNEEKSHLMAFEAGTGKVLWDVPRDEKTNYSTPFLWENEKRTELVVSGISWCQSYSLEGAPLWKIKGKSILAIPTPFAWEGNLYVTSGHVAWGENPIYCIKPGHDGDLSPVEGSALPAGLLWHHPTGGPYHPTPIIVDGIFYVLLDRGFLSAYDARTGTPIYIKKRIPNGRAFTSSPWTYRGELFAVNEDGLTFRLALGKEFKVLGTNELAEDDMCMATPVVAGDRLLIRSSERVYSIRTPTSKP